MSEASTHYFSAPDDDKSSRWCQHCGEYLTHPNHVQHHPVNKEEIDRLEFMENNGLGEEDMRSDVTYPKEL